MKRILLASAAALLCVGAAKADGVAITTETDQGGPAIVAPAPVDPDTMSSTTVVKKRVHPDGSTTVVKKKFDDDGGSKTVIVHHDDDDDGD